MITSISADSMKGVGGRRPMKGVGGRPTEVVFLRENFGILKLV